MSISTYLMNLLIAADRFGNTVMGGDPDETISARSGRLRDKDPKTWGVLAELLDQIQKNHVQDAIQNDAARASFTLAVEKAAEHAGLANG